MLCFLTLGWTLTGTAFGGPGAERLDGTAKGEALADRDGNDVIYGLSGGAGRDVLLGNGGDDFLEARGGTKDFIGCGAGRDVVSADTEDEVSADCEAVYRSRTDPTTTSPYKLAG